MTAVVLALPENDRLANRLGASLDLAVSPVVVHRFPDGEARVRVNRSVAEATLTELPEPNPERTPTEEF